MAEWRVYGDWILLSDLEQYNLAIDADERATVAEAQRGDLRQRLAAAEAALARIALEVSGCGGYSQAEVAQHALGWKPAHVLWEMVKAARAEGGGE
jgi:hypothetical protein